jgi:hypothetical protein
MRRANRRDAAEPGIVKELEAVGAYVVRLHQPVDLLVLYRGQRHLLEIKTPGRARRHDQEAQEAFCKAFDVPLIRTPTEALRAVGAITDRQGDNRAVNQP